MTNSMPPREIAADPFARSREARRIAATRLLAHRLFHRACRLGAEPDLTAAIRLVDERLAPDARVRRAVAVEALGLCREALRRRRPGGPLEGRVETYLAAALEVTRRSPDRPGADRVTGHGFRRRVVIPTLVHRPGGQLSVLALRPTGDRRAGARLRDYRRAAARLFGRPAAGVLVGPAATRSEPAGGRNRGRGCSRSAPGRSGRRPR